MPPVLPADRGFPAFLEASRRNTLNSLNDSRNAVQIFDRVDIEAGKKFANCTIEFLFLCLFEEYLILPSLGIKFPELLLDF